jgi:hypothetical protein
MIQWVVQAANSNFVKIFPTVEYRTVHGGAGTMEIVSLTCPGAVTDYPFLMYRYLYTNSRKLYLVSLIIPVLWSRSALVSIFQLETGSGSRSLRIRSGSYYMMTKSCLIFTVENQLHILLIKNGINLYPGNYAGRPS